MSGSASSASARRALIEENWRPGGADRIGGRVLGKQAALATSLLENIARALAHHIQEPSSSSASSSGEMVVR